MDFSDKTLIGELSLTGEVRRIDGVLPMCVHARDIGKKEIYVPIENASEASVVEGITVFGVPSLHALVDHFLGKAPIEPTPMHFDPARLSRRDGEDDFCEVRGQLKAKRALEIAAAGGHNVLLIGPPGAGKSMLAKRLGSILPDMSFDEAISATKVHSVTGSLKTDLICRRPFRSPHHTVTAIGMVGGGSNPKPGEISLASTGVLFLDELPEFPKKVLEALRQPLEDGEVTVTRANAKVTYPSRFMLVCAMNPCQCGYFGDPQRQCTCSPAAVHKYLDRISGPMLDRMDIIIELPSVSYDEISGKAPEGERSAAIRERVNAAIAFAKKRLEAANDTSEALNAQMTPAQLHTKLNLRFLICGVVRDGQAYIPKGDFVLAEGDNVCLTAHDEEMINFFKAIGAYKHPVRDVLIVGGGRLTYYLLGHLQKTKIRATVIEPDKQRCRELAERYDCNVIRDDGTNQSVLKEEGIAKTDAFLALSSEDEENAIVSLYAKSQNTKKVITLISALQYVELFKSMGLDGIVSPKYSTSNEILRYVRSMDATHDIEIESLHRLMDDSFEALECVIKEPVEGITGIPLKNLKLRRDVLIACIVHKDKIVIPSGNDKMESGDTVILFTSGVEINEIKDILK